VALLASAELRDTRGFISDYNHAAIFGIYRELHVRTAGSTPTSR